MATDIFAFAVLISSTNHYSPATALVADLTMPPRTVRKITVKTPPGPRGSLFWTIGHAGIGLYPTSAPGQLANYGVAWAQTDNEVTELAVTDKVDSGSWQLIAYAAGIYSHTLYITFECDLIEQSAAPAARVTNDQISAPLSTADLNAAPAATSQTPQTAAAPVAVAPAVQTVRPSEIAPHAAPAGATPSPGSVQWIPPSGTTP